MASTATQLTVVVPSHDTAGLTLACLASLERCTTPHEVLLVDDASRDGTPTAVHRRFPRVRILELDHQVGFTRAVNAGLAASESELVLLLNSDAEVLGDFSPLVEAFRHDLRLGAVGASLRYPDGRPQWSGGAAPTALWLFGLASGLPHRLAAVPGYRRWRSPSGHGGGTVDWIPGTAMGLRRAALDQIGTFDEGLPLYAQDLELCTRLAGAGWAVRVEPRFAVLHHLGATILQGDASRATGQDVVALWRDLLAWAVRHRDPSWVATAVDALRAGGVLRYVLLQLERLTRRQRREALTDELRRLREALSLLDSRTAVAGSNQPAAGRPGER